MPRSLLFIPGNQPNMLQNAYLFDADAIIFDLEDSVHVSEKDNARNLVSQFLKQTIKPKQVLNFVRINSMDTPYFEEDLDKICDEFIDGIVLPKATVETVNVLNTFLDDFIVKNASSHAFQIIPIIESALSVLQVDEIASLPRVSGLLLGAEDLTRDLSVKRTLSGDEIFYARAKVIMACAAFRIDSIDTPFTDVFNDEAMKQDALRAKQLGMKAKSAIHPRHIETINSVFSPSKAEIEEALAILDAKAKADKEARGAFSYQGKMVDKPIIDRAKETIAKAKAYRLLRNSHE